MWPWLVCILSRHDVFLWFSLLSPCPIGTAFGKKTTLLGVSTKNSPPWLITKDGVISSVQDCGTFQRRGWGELALVHGHHPLVSSCYVLCSLYVQTTKMVRYTLDLALPIPLSNSATWRRPGTLSWCWGVALALAELSFLICQVGLRISSASQKLGKFSKTIVISPHQSTTM